MSRNVNVPDDHRPVGPEPRPSRSALRQQRAVPVDRRLLVRRRDALADASGPSTWGSVRLSYTLSKGLDTSGNFFFSQPQDANDIAAERGRSDNDQRHRLALSGTLTRRARRHAVADRERLAVQLHLHLHLGAAVQHPAAERPQRRHELQRPPRGRRAATPAKASTTSRSTFASAGRSRSRAAVSVEAIVDAFNVLNRANYQVPNNIITSPTFGQPDRGERPAAVAARDTVFVLMAVCLSGSGGPVR